MKIVKKNDLAKKVYRGECKCGCMFEGTEHETTRISFIRMALFLMVYERWGRCPSCGRWRAMDFHRYYDDMMRIRV